MAGSVGIGTTSPASKLDVSQNQIGNAGGTGAAFTATYAPTSNTSAVIYGINSSLNLNNTAADVTTGAVGIYQNISSGQGFLQSTGPVKLVSGKYTGSATGGSINTVTGFDADIAGAGGTETIANGIGLNVVVSGTVSNGYGVKIGSVAGSVNSFGVFQGSSSSKNYFAGNVGIGTTNPSAKLDVSGDIRVGNSAATCSATTKGSIRYNTGTNLIEFCNGTSWGSIHTATACSDATPDAIAFTDQPNASLSTSTSSNIVQVTGINCAVAASISGLGSPQLRTCSDAACSSVVQDWTSSPASISNNEYVQLRLTSNAAGGVVYQSTVIVGSAAGVWTVTTAGSDCTNTTPPAGAVCSDGTVYAGLSPDGAVKMFTTRCDFGQTWNGTSCTGTRLPQTWNNGSSNYTTTGYTNDNTGKANSAALSALSTAAAVHYAARVCEDLSQDGYTDWYLPSRNELQVLYNNNAVIGNFTANTFWSSTASGSYGNGAFQRNFSNGVERDDYSQAVPNYIRCVRR